MRPVTLYRNLVSFLLILLLCVCADGLMDVFGYIWTLVIGIAVLVTAALIAEK